MSKKNEKIVLTLDQVKFIKVHRKRYLRDAEFEDQTFFQELEWNVTAYLRYNPRFKKPFKFADGVQYKPALPLDRALLSAAKKIQSSMRRYHKIFLHYTRVGYLKSDPMLHGPFFELYEQTARAASTLERINEVIHNITYVDKNEHHYFTLLSLIYELGGHIQEVVSTRLRPAAEHAFNMKKKSRKISRSLPLEDIPWLIERAKHHDATRMDRILIFETVAEEYRVKRPTNKPFGWRCMQDHLKPHLPPRYRPRKRRSIRGK